MGRYRGRHAADRTTEFVSGRLRRGVSSAAVAAAAMAALTASQAPGVQIVQPGGEDEGSAESLPDLPPGDDSYHTELPPLRTPAPPGRGSPTPGGGNGAGGVGDESGIPATVLSAYKNAESSLARTDPGCNLPWELLAAIGKVESGQARGGAVDANGTTHAPILGPVLDGDGFAHIGDTDGGAYDGDTRFDRAVGPMQFIPSTWADWGADGNGDGRKDPNNVFDAALAAGAYLCHGERNLAVKADLDRAVLSYNHSQDYLDTVLAWLEYYRDGVHEVPDGTGALPTSPGAGGPGGGHRDPAGSSGTGGPGRTGDPSGTKGGDSGGHGDGSSDGGSTPSDDESSSDEDTSDPAEAGPATLHRTQQEPVAIPLGGALDGGFGVKVLTDSGAAVPGAEVRYEVLAPGDAAEVRFAGDEARPVVTTGTGGRATAPELLAGEREATVTVRATVPGHQEVSAVDFTVTTARAALERIDEEEPLTVPEEGTLSGIRVRAAYGSEGLTVEDVPVTVTVLDEEGEHLEEPGTGPYFLGRDDSHAREAKTVTQENGEAVLPDLHAGSGTGFYTLRVTTEDGGELMLDVEVAEEGTSESSPAPSPTATSSSPAPSPTVTSSSPTASPSPTEPSPTSTTSAASTSSPSATSSESTTTEPTTSPSPSAS
ncbi:lytic murein transglycosylase [Streptomyces sp. TR06-5]|uniref:lytic murein transglycosylase n=1 Tax=Streptomyces sp. TR06-5 TaxID=3385976 RepID=UPI00399F591B